jgi:hypothetical protein
MPIELVRILVLMFGVFIGLGFSQAIARFLWKRGIHPPYPIWSETLMAVVAWAAIAIVVKMPDFPLISNYSFRQGFVIGLGIFLTVPIMVTFFTQRTSHSPHPFGAAPIRSTMLEQEYATTASTPTQARIEFMLQGHDAPQAPVEAQETSLGPIPGTVTRSTVQGRIEA